MKKNSNFELLRIISIFLIVAHHFVYNTGMYGVGTLDQPLGLNRFFGQFLNAGAYIGVACFFMITGWFSGDRKFKSKHIVKVYGPTIFYSLAFLGVALIFFRDKVTFARILKSVFPVTFTAWWFVTAYIGVMLLSPFMNLLLKNMNEKIFRSFLMIGIIMLLATHTLTTQRPYFSDLAMGCFYYMAAAGFRKFDIFHHVRWKKFMNLYWSLLFFALICFSTVVFSVLELYIPKVHKGINFLTGIDTLTIFVVSVTLFGYFANRKSFSNGVIDYFGKRTFAVYLIQSNVFISPVLWTWFAESGINESSFYVLLAPLAVTGICLVCVGIEQIRMWLGALAAKVFHGRMTDKLCAKADNFFVE